MSNTVEFELDIQDLMVTDPHSVNALLTEKAGGEIRDYSVVDFKGNGSTVVVVEATLV